MNTPPTPRSRPKELSSHRRGYGALHRSRRQRIAVVVAGGNVRCAAGADCYEAEVVDGVRVGGIIDPNEPWDLGHVPGDRLHYRGPEHRRCNRATARRATRTTSREW